MFASGIPCHPPSRLPPPSDDGGRPHFRDDDRRRIPPPLPYMRPPSDAAVPGRLDVMPPPPPRLPDPVSSSAGGPRPPPLPNRTVRWEPPQHPPPSSPNRRRPPRRDSRDGAGDSPPPASTSASARASPPSCSSSSSSSRLLCPTSAVAHLPTDHGRLRRLQRGISVRDLKLARKRGRRRPAAAGGRRSGRSVYEYRGVAYVEDDATGREVTSYATEESLPLRPIDAEERRMHEEAATRVRLDRSAWRSHTVFLVDASGSMRMSDVRGARTRLGAAWVALARDYVAQRIRTGEATEMDVVTVVRMGEGADVLIREAPTDWCLYNRILRMHHDEEVAPGGHGYYGPALRLAEELLGSNDSSSCALVLGMLSDGRPSDSVLCRASFEASNASLTEQVRAMASRLGRRLTVAAIGMGSDVPGEFAVLRDMADAARDYGSAGTFQLPSMTCSGLGAAMTSVATSLTLSQTELAGDDPAGRQRKVRTVTRENRKHVPLWTEVVDKEGFDTYMGDKVEHMLYDPAVDGNFRKVPLQHPDARGVAIKKRPFGEGQERFAYQFFEVAEDGETVVGEPLVAKESRFVEDEESVGGERGGRQPPTDCFGRAALNWEDRDRFVKRFCRIQHQAEAAARTFNDKLDGIRKLDPDTARVSFLGCSVYYLTDDVKGQFAVLVEHRLDGKFQKWNSNNGWHSGQKRRRVELDTVAEERAADEEDEREVICLSDGGTEDIFVTHGEVAQAFSHFSYVHSGSKLLICDLQGVYSRPDRMLRFTDPVIHYHDVRKHGSRRVYGRTDLGRRGIHRFFDSHVCNGLCDLVTRGFREPHPSKLPKAD